MNEFTVPKDIKVSENSKEFSKTPFSKIDTSRPLDFRRHDENLETKDFIDTSKPLDYRKGETQNEAVNSKTETKDFDPDKKAEVSYNETREPQSEAKDFDPDKKAEVSEGKDVPREIQTRNEDLEGKEHPVTEVPFEKKTVKDADGNEVTGVFPEFESTFDAQLPEDLYKATDREQFGECNTQLKEKVENDPEFAKKFTPEQREQIKNGDTPDGYTWHHNEETGKMQLVDSDVHAKTGHTGGKTIWGGGNDNR